MQTLHTEPEQPEIMSRKLIDNSKFINDESSNHLFGLEGGFVFEDSKISKFQFEQYRLVEIARLFMLICSLFLGMIAYDGEFFSSKQLSQKLLLYAISIQTIIIEILTVCAGFCYFRYQKTCNAVPPKSSFFEGTYFKTMIFEMFVQLIHPTPFTRDIKIQYFDNISFIEYFYFLNEILIYIQFFRVIVAFKVGLKLTHYFSSQVSRICKFYSVEMNDSFIFKCLLYNNPFRIQIIIYSLGTFFFAILYRISERPSTRTEDETNGEYIYNLSALDNTYQLALWVTTITIPTVGYGDFSPTTSLGRISMSLCVIWGINMTSLFLASLLITIGVSNGENMSFAIIQRVVTHQKVREEAAQIITRVCHLNLMHKRSMLSSQRALEVVSTMKSSSMQLKRHKRTYDSIDGESLQSLMDRNFIFMKQQTTSLYEELSAVADNQIIIKRYLVEKAMTESNMIQSWGLQTADFRPERAQQQSLYSRKQEPQQFSVNPTSFATKKGRPRMSLQHSFHPRSKNHSFFENLVDNDKELRNKINKIIRNPLFR